MTAAATEMRSPVKQSRFMRRALPYILSLPALLMCIGILIPFFTAVYYSMLRYRMNLPAMKGFIWFQNYINFFTDPKFWNTVYISLVYAFLTVGLELLLGLAIALLLQRPSRFNNIASMLLRCKRGALTALAVSTATRSAAAPPRRLQDDAGSRAKARRDAPVAPEGEPCVDRRDQPD